MMPQVGQEAFEFSLPDQDGEVRKLSDFRGSWVILYFYPKDDTPGCTAEACQFRDLLPRLGEGGAIVLGVSIDPVKKHQRFAQKYQLPFRILSDEQKDVVTQYGVWAEKTFMGKSYMGIDRTTIIIDPQGLVVKVYQQVKPEGHAAMVADDLPVLQQAP
jgi:peroxiredoxin Q/BCP